MNFFEVQSPNISIFISIYNTCVWDWSDSFKSKDVSISNLRHPCFESHAGLHWFTV